MSIQRSRLAPSLPASAFAVLTVLAVTLGLGSPAAAIELNLERLDTLDLGGRAIVQTEVQLEEVKLGIFGGGTVVYEKVVHTIEFVGGPVEITRFEKNGLLDVAVKTVGDDVLKRLHLGALDEPMMVEKIHLKSLDLGSETGALHIDVRHDIASSAPVPEPGAALLFGAGLVVASRIRRP